MGKRSFFQSCTVKCFTFMPCQLQIASQEDCKCAVFYFLFFFFILTFFFSFFFLYWPNAYSLPIWVRMAFAFSNPFFPIWFVNVPPIRTCFTERGQNHFTGVSQNESIGFSTSCLLDKKKGKGGRRTLNKDRWNFTENLPLSQV